MFIEKLENELNVSTTENGATGYKTTKKALLDLNFAVASLRSATDIQIRNKFKDAWFEDQELALKWLFFARDVREGLGERRLFRVIIKDLANAFTTDLIKWIVEYGRYDDLFSLMGSNLEEALIRELKNQLLTDVKLMSQNKSVSLLAKWMPSEKHII